MKIAVSIPDDVFAEAEVLAKQLGTSRSDIYSRALSEFVGRHAPERLTDLMNRAVEAAGEGGDAFVQRAARRGARRAEW